MNQARTRSLSSSSVSLICLVAGLSRKRSSAALPATRACGTISHLRLLAPIGILIDELKPSKTPFAKLSASLFASLGDQSTTVRILIFFM